MFIHHSAGHICLILVVLDCSIATWVRGKYIRAMDFHFWHIGNWAWIKCVRYEREKEACFTVSNKEFITGITKYLVRCLICNLFICCGISLESRKYAVAVTLCICVLTCGNCICL